MTTGRKTLIYALAIFSVVSLGWIALVGAVYAANGMLTVRVIDRESGFRFYLPLPATVVEGAVATGDHLIDQQSFHQGVAELEAWMPMVEEVLGVFDDAPDAVFVNVVDGSEHVRVSKRSGSLQVQVLSDALEVEVRVPIRTVRRVAARLTG